MDEKKDLRFGEPIADVISRRKSVRTYADTPVSDEIRVRINEFTSQLHGPFGVKTRLVLLDKAKERTDEKIRLGTYGVISGAGLFMAGVVEKKERAMEELGYVLEETILYMTHLGLGTCWLAASFGKGEFKKAAAVQDREYIPIVTPVGYPSSQRTPIDLLFKLPGRKERKDWKELFYQNTFDTPLAQEAAGDYATPLEMVRLAPSASNRQPWRIVKAGKDYHFYLVHNTGYDRIFGYDIQKIDMGIAMCHWELAAREAGLAGRWETADPGIQTAVNTEYIVSWRSN